MPRLISKAELSRLVGVSPAAVGKQCRGNLSPAMVGDRVDQDHPTVVAWLKSRGVKPTKGRSKPQKSPPRPTEPRRTQPRREAKAEGHELLKLSDVEGFEDMTLREITDRFPTRIGVRDWLDARKKVVDIREKELKNWETEGKLIPREAVRAHVFGAIDGANRRLLQDSPKTIARRLYALAKSGASVEEAERVVRETIGSQLRPVKDTAARALRKP